MKTIFLLLFLIPSVSLANIPTTKVSDVKESITVLKFCCVAFAYFRGEVKGIPEARKIFPQMDGLIYEINKVGLPVQIEISGLLGVECKGA